MAEAEGQKEQSMTAQREGETDRRSRRSLLKTGFGVMLVGSLTGCQSLIPRALSDTDAGDESPTATFYDDWSDGGMERWVEYRANGDGDSMVQQMETPSGGTRVLSVSQSEGSGTEYILGTQAGFNGWSGSWRLRTLFHTTELDPSVDYQSYELIPGYFTDDGDDPRLSFIAGVRDGDGMVIPAMFGGEGVENTRTHALEWRSDRWYHVELEHDGNGGFSGTVWPDDESAPENPNVEATGPVPESGARPLAMRVDGPSFPEFQLSHAFIELSMNSSES